MRHFNRVYLVAGSLLALVLFLGNSSGAANNNRFFSGAPRANGNGTESTCSTCHNSGSGDFGLPEVEWTVAATQGGDGVSDYLPGQTYFVTVAVSSPDAAPGVTPAGYGFQSVFLNANNEPNDNSPSANVGSFTNFSAEAQGIAANTRTYIEHNQVTASGVWTFEWTAPPAGTGPVSIYSVGNIVNGNFGTTGDSGSSSPTVVTLQEDATMPVTLSAFTGRAVKNTVTLDWATDLEENFSHFTVERAVAGGGMFAAVEDVPAKSDNGATYSLTDNDLPGGDYFYRLRTNDTDGSSAYSNVLSISVDATVYTAYPNPTAGPLTITDNEARYRLLDGTGQVVRANLRAGTSDISALTPGIYLLERTTETGRTVQRLVKR